MFTIASLAVRIEIHNRSTLACVIDLLDGALLLQKQFLDSIVHLMNLKVSIFHHFTYLVKGQLVKELFVVLVCAFTTTRILMSGEARAGDRGLVSVGQLGYVEAAPRHIHELD